ncbi:hypothetical protein [Mahella australiensis]|uniref:ERF family protein n=1 Tax=Mahella australiensis (strain DSM 15567 / CIP 107919 / 50-1 BON) TaxID=697281 RepID=F3ZZE5_MAHA5|nr:hypothetical protein [Mahella australiensis]AEE95755.1 hypothetical protein Mahau_0551 [Mahella australiensis 50-1 BON]
MDIQEINSLSLIDSVSLQQVQATMQKISQFQQIIQKTLHQNHDYGVVPGTDKPTLLKPGAEKILMMMGLRSEFEIVDSTRDWETGFFQYQVRCKLYKGDILITEGLGCANTRESKYAKQNPFSIDNTILKMAKKRALVDATLLVASLSDIFTQDLEDMDLNGEAIERKEQSRSYSNTNETTSASQQQIKAIFAIAGKLGCNGENEVLALLEAIGHHVDSLKDLSKKEASDIITELNTKLEESRNAQA